MIFSVLFLAVRIGAGSPKRTPMFNIVQPCDSGRRGSDAHDAFGWLIPIKKITSTCIDDPLPVYHNQVRSRWIRHKLVPEPLIKRCSTSATKKNFFTCYFFSKVPEACGMGGRRTCPERPGNTEKPCGNVDNRARGPSHGTGIQGGAKHERNFCPGADGIKRDEFCTPPPE